MKSFSLIKPYLYENRFIISAGLLCLIMVDLLQLVIPRVIKHAIDDLSSMKIDSTVLLTYALYIVGITLFIGLFRYIWRLCLLGTSRKVEEGLRNRLFEHIQALSASYFTKAKSGDLMAHATNDINNIKISTGMGIVALTDAVILGGTAAAFMSYINVKLTLLTLIPMPVVAALMHFFNQRMHSQYQRVQGTFADMTEMIRERFAGIRIIKAFLMEEKALEQVRQVSGKYVKDNIVLKKITGALFPMFMLLTNVSLVILVYFGGGLTIKSEISTGDFVAFISYLYIITWPMVALGWVINLIQRGGASLDRINVILKTRPEILDKPGALPVPEISGEIRFENIWFSYERDGAPVLDGIDYTVGPGKILGIMGPPGSGKTTLLGLVPRLFDPRKGRVLLDSLDIRDMRLSELRKHISLMPQEPFMFSGTIRDNITLGRNFSEKDLSAAVNKASLASMIDSFPMGLDTLVGEKGVTLSGGQKQRIALARALLDDSKILLLDDPISQVDANTARDIIKVIRQLAGEKTVIVVSHRVSIMQYTDRILVLKQGRIAEEGTHRELISGKKYYAETYRAQALEEALNEN